MEVDYDLVATLTNQGPGFQEAWSNFMFNMQWALSLKKKEVQEEKIIDMLAAGAAYLGGGMDHGACFQGALRIVRCGNCQAPDRAIS